MKNLVIFGDSISTEFHGERGYMPSLEKAGFKIYNYAVSASGLSHTTPNSALELIKSMGKHICHVDDVILWHGTNDWYYHVPQEIFESDFDLTLNLLKENYPNAVITVVTPLIRYQAPHTSSRKACLAFECMNHALLTLSDYKNMIVKLCIKHQLRVIDMDRHTAFNLGNIDCFFEDRIHPNVAGYNKISSIIIRKLQSSD